MANSVRPDPPQFGPADRFGRPVDPAKRPCEAKAARAANGRSGKMKALAATGVQRESRAGRQAQMESNIVDTMRRYFQNDTGKTKGDLEYTILNSVKRYFEGKHPEKQR